MQGKDLITYAVLGVVALLIVGALGYTALPGSPTYLHYLSLPNTTQGAVITISAVVLPIIFLIAVVLKFL